MKRFCLLLILMASLLPGCGGKDKVKPSDDSLLATEAFASIDGMKAAYLEKDADRFRTYADPALAHSIIRGLVFDSAELTITKRMVRITDASVAVNIAWQGSWQNTRSGKLDNRGVADLIFDRETMKLVSVEGDNPFMMPSSDTPR